MIMKTGYTNYKTGAASFYIVAFSTLILMVVAASFASAIVAELERSSNDDLAQSAYDAAMAGVEDAKIAFANYRACLTEGETGESLSVLDNVSCEDIVYWVNHPNGADGYNACEMVGRVLGRIGKKDDSDEDASVVEVKEGDSNNDMDQAYTCVKILTQTSDYRATLTSLNPYKVIKASFSDGVQAKDIKKVKLSWWLNQEGVTENFNNSPSGKLKQANFIPLDVANNKTPTPPTMALQFLQSVHKKNLHNLLSQRIDDALDIHTNRATMYLVPTDKEMVATGEGGDFGNTDFMSRPAYDDGAKKNILIPLDSVRTNDHGKDAPFVVYCDAGMETEFLCSVTINLPYPIGTNAERDDGTFTFIVYLPYETPDTDFSLEFYKDGDDKPVAIKDTQLVIDSTGRANSLYSRVEVRLEQEANFHYPLYAVQAESLEKELTVQKEYSENDYGNYLEHIDSPLNIPGGEQIDF